MKELQPKVSHSGSEERQCCKWWEDLRAGRPLDAQNVSLRQQRQQLARPPARQLARQL